MRVAKASLVFLVLLGAVTGSMAAPKICIDPGHGGTDPGAVANGLQEKNLNLAKALKFRNWLNLDTQDTSGGYSWSIIMTRTTDKTVSLYARSSYANANSANRFISIHHNANESTSPRGSSTHIYLTTGSTTNDLGAKVHEELIAHGKLNNRGLLRNNFHVLRETTMSAVLTEGGFVTNSSDAAIISQSSWQNEVAKGFMHAFQRHYGKAAYTPSSGTSVSVITDNSSSKFSASSNWGTATWSSDKYSSDYAYRSTASLSDPATWSASLPSSGSYKVYAWWTAASNRATAAPYIIDHTSGSSTVKKDQSANGGKWNLLGTYNLSSGTNQVQLSCWTTSGDVVIADAIKWQK